MKYLLWITLAACIALPASGQRVFQGGVLDDESGFPLPTATLFLPALESGVATNQEGQFELRIDPLPVDV